jgi:hypothetical protein
MLKIGRCLCRFLCRTPKQEQSGEIGSNPEQAKSRASADGGLTLSRTPGSFCRLEGCSSLVQFSGQFVDHVAREDPIPLTGNALKNEVGMLRLPVG